MKTAMGAMMVLATLLCCSPARAALDYFVVQGVTSATDANLHILRYDTVAKTVSHVTTVTRTMPGSYVKLAPGVDGAFWAGVYNGASGEGAERFIPNANRTSWSSDFAVNMSQQQGSGAFYNTSVRSGNQNGDTATPGVAELANGRFMAVDGKRNTTYMNPYALSTVKATWSGTITDAGFVTGSGGWLDSSCWFSADGVVADVAAAVAGTSGRFLVTGLTGNTGIGVYNAANSFRGTLTDITTPTIHSAVGMMKTVPLGDVALILAGPNAAGSVTFQVAGRSVKEANFNAEVIPEFTVSGDGTTTWVEANEVDGTQSGLIMVCGRGRKGTDAPSVRFYETNGTAHSSIFWLKDTIPGIGTASSSLKCYATCLWFTPPEPYIVNDGAKNVTASSADLTGTLMSTGTTATAVYVFWGTTDGLDTRSSWAHTNSFGTNTTGPRSYSTNVTGLASGQDYYYRFYATNQAGAVWATPSIHFQTEAQAAFLSYSGAGYGELPANNGSVSNIPIVATLTGETFAGANGDNLATNGRVTATSVPAGLTLSAVRQSDTVVHLKLTGAANLPHNAANNVNNLTFQFQNGAFAALPASSVGSSTQGGFFVHFLNPRVTYSGTAFNEALANDGSMGNTLTLTLAGDVLAGSVNDDFVLTSRATVNNVPDGLTASIVRTDATTLVASLSGKATVHEPPNVANLTFALLNNAFANTAAAAVSNATVSTLSVNYLYSPVTYHVATNGLDTNTGAGWGSALATITNALSRCRTAAGDVVYLGPGVFTQPTNTVSKSVVIRGSGMHDTIVQAATTRSNATGRIFTVPTGGLTVSIRDMTLRHGYANDNGGAIGFTASAAGTYALLNCRFSENDTQGGKHGGAVYIHNSGGGAALTVSNCLFSGNAASGSGGGLYMNQAQSVSLDGCTFQNNRAVVSAGGLATSLPGTGRLDARNCTFFGNSAATGSGGAISVLGGSNYYNHVTIVSNTAGNTGGGMRIDNLYTLLRNSIVAGNYDGAGMREIWTQAGTAIATNSLVRGSVWGVTTTGCLTGQDPKLSPPADNGGPLPTCALQAGSPCIGAANPATALAADQRGVVRDAAPDMGAFEWVANPRLVYSATVFNESAANDGTIDNSVPMLITVLDETFGGANNEDFVASGKLAVDNKSPGLTFVARRTDTNELSVTVSDAATAHGSANDVTDLTFTFDDSAFTGGDAGAVSNATRSDLEIRYLDAALDPVLTWSGSGFTEAAANDGSIAATPHVTVSVDNDTFAGTNGQNLAAGGWVTAANLPAGLSLVVTRTSPLLATVTLAGARGIPHNAAQNVADLTLTVTGNALASSPPTASITNGTSPALSIAFANPVLTYSGSAFSESVVNDGSIANSLAITLKGERFSGATGDNFAGGKVTVSGVPVGLAAVLTRTGPTNLTATLSGRAWHHAVADNVSDLAFTFQTAAFSNTPASTVTDYAKSGMTISYIANPVTYHVATNGLDSNTGASLADALATITNALSRCRAAASDIVLLGPGVFTQPTNTVGKSVVIRGMGMHDTIVQAAASRSNAPGRIFTVATAGLTLSFRDMTLRHGYMAGHGGAVGFTAEGAGTYTLANCHFTANDTRASGNGGAVYLNNNNGGAVMAISNCLFSANTAAAYGGGFYSWMAQSYVLDSCTFMSNLAAFAGGGLSVRMGSNGRNNMHNTTFYGNRAAGGAGGAFVLTGGTNYFNHITVVSNTAAGTGGGIRTSDAASWLCNSILAGNRDSGGAREIWCQNGGMNAEDSLIQASAFGATLTRCLTGQDPKLLPPADNGGPVPTCRLLPGGPCIGKANPATALPDDARGYMRVEGPDMGAFEYGALPFPYAGTVFILR